MSVARVVERIEMGPGAFTHHYFGNNFDEKLEIMTDPRMRATERNWSVFHEINSMHDKFEDRGYCVKHMIQSYNFYPNIPIQHRMPNAGDVISFAKYFFEEEENNTPCYRCQVDRCCGDCSCCD